MLGQLARNTAFLRDNRAGAAGEHDPESARLSARPVAELLFQPRFRLADRSLAAVQASAARPRLGLNLRAPRPLPAGRETRDVGRDGAMLRHACRIAAELQPHSRTSPPTLLSMRITEAQAASGLLARLIGEVLCECGLRPECLELEFSEDSLQADESDMLYTLAALRDIGVGLVLGGFGSGVSSLTLLRRRSLAGLLSGLKLDRLVVHELGEAARDDGFLHGLAASAHALGLLVFADGIETDLQCRRLLDAGCDQGLGCLLAEPQPAADWARRQRGAAS